MLGTCSVYTNGIGNFYISHAYFYIYHKLWQFFKELFLGGFSDMNKGLVLLGSNWVYVPDRGQ